MVPRTFWRSSCSAVKQSLQASKISQRSQIYSQAAAQGSTMPERKDPYTLLVVALAMVDTEKSKVLLAERPSKKHLEGLYEFPGGKVERNESPEEALVREIKEEIGVDVLVDDLTPLAFASHAYEEKGFHLLMPLFACTKWKGVPEGRENQRLVWATREELETYEMPPADYPLLPALRELLQQYE